MLRLAIARRGAASAAVPSLDEPEVRVWKDTGGRVCGFGYTLGNSHWIHLPRVAAYRFTRESDVVTAFPDPDARSDLVRLYFHHSVLPIALQTLHSELEVLHASGVCLGPGLVLLCGNSGTGKSTTAYGMSRRGYRLWADDSVMLEIEGSEIRALPLPFDVRLRPASMSFFNPDHADRGRTSGQRGAGKGARKAARIAALILLKRTQPTTGRPPVVTRRLSPGAAFASVLAQGDCLSLHDEERKRRMLQNYLLMAARLPVIDVRFQSGLETLPALLDRIERVVSEQVRRPEGGV